MVTGLPLQRFPALHTDDPAVWMERLSTACGAGGFDVRESSRPFEVTINYVQLKQLSLAASKHAGTAGFRMPTYNTIRQPFTISGTATVDFDHRHFAVNREETCVVPADTDSALSYQDQFSYLALIIETPVLSAKLGALLGFPVAGGIEFSATANFDNPELARLRRLLDFFVAELDRPDAQLADQALAEFEQLLIVSFLTANRHNYSDRLQREQPRPAPWQVRVVEEYIEAHWNEPLTLEILANATGGSVRSIFKAFKTSRGMTPMAFVKGIRLKQARRMLEAPDHNTSVIGVSLHCGFFNPGHFARHYRAAFGELPSTTLARSRRPRTAAG